MVTVNATRMVRKEKMVGVSTESWDKTKHSHLKLPIVSASIYVKHRNPRKILTGIFGNLCPAASYTHKITSGMV